MKLCRQKGPGYFLCNIYTMYLYKERAVDYMWGKLLIDNRRNALDVWLSVECRCNTLSARCKPSCTRFTCGAHARCFRSRCWCQHSGLMVPIKFIFNFIDTFIGGRRRGWSNRAPGWPLQRARGHVVVVQGENASPLCLRVICSRCLRDKCRKPLWHVSVFGTPREGYG